LTDPASSTATLAITGAGITIFGVVTGLHPDILLAGFAGGVWAQSYLPQTTLFRRVSTTLGSAIVAGYLTPISVALLKNSSTGDLFQEIAQTAIALVIGLISQKVIGPALLRISENRLKDVDHEP